MITDKVGGSSAKPEVSKQSKEKRLKHKVSGYKSQSKRRSIAGCRLLLRTLNWPQLKKKNNNNNNNNKKKTGQNMFSSSFAFYSANSWYKGSCSSASPNSRCHLSSCILAVLSLFSGSSWGVSSSQNTWNIWPKFCTAHQNNPTLSLALLSCCPLFGINFTCMLYFWWNCCCFVGSL